MQHAAQKDTIAQDIHKKTSQCPITTHEKTTFISMWFLRCFQGGIIIDNACENQI